MTMTSYGLKGLYLLWTARRGLPGEQDSVVCHRTGTVQCERRSGRSLGTLPAVPRHVLSAPTLHRECDSVSCGEVDLGRTGLRPGVLGFRAGAVEPEGVAHLIGHVIRLVAR